MSGKESNPGLLLRLLGLLFDLHNSGLHFLLMQNSIIAKYIEINQMAFNFLGEVIRYQFFISFLCFCLEMFVPAIKGEVDYYCGWY